jgi:hypothetical protein
LLLPTASCPSCKRTSLVYRSLREGPGGQEVLESRCADCDTRLDRFGLAPIITEQSFSSLAGLGYEDLDRPAPVGPGGCFVGGGCEGCPKIDTRPW